MEGNPKGTDDQSRDVLDSVCAANPTADIAEVVAEYHADVYRYAYRLSQRQADAEDLTQQTFLIAQEKLSQVRDASKVRGWLLVVLRSLFLKSRRKKTPVPAGGLELELEQIPANDESNDEIDSEHLQQVLATLPDDYRLVLGLFYFEEMSYKEIAAELEVPLGTVMSRLSRAKGQLRQGLLVSQSGDTNDSDTKQTRTSRVKKGSSKVL